MNRIRKARNHLKKEIELTLANVIFDYDLEKYKTTQKLKRDLSPTQRVSFDKMVDFFSHHSVPLRELEIIVSSNPNSLNYRNTKRRIIRFWHYSLKHFRKKILH